MKLRDLKLKDAPLMLEWMHDEELVRFFRTDFQDKTLGDCEAFIQTAAAEQNRHWAICNDEDEYLGTVSLKHMDPQNGTAEYAIAIGIGLKRIETRSGIRIDRLRRPPSTGRPVRR